jgi:hypothetical protein
VTATQLRHLEFVAPHTPEWSRYGRESMAKLTSKKWNIPDEQFESQLREARERDAMADRRFHSGAMRLEINDLY